MEMGQRGGFGSILRRGLSILFGKRSLDNWVGKDLEPPVRLSSEYGSERELIVELDV